MRAEYTIRSVFSVFIIKKKTVETLRGVYLALMEHLAGNFRDASLESGTAVCGVRDRAIYANKCLQCLLRLSYVNKRLLRLLTHSNHHTTVAKTDRPPRSRL